MKKTVKRRYLPKAFGGLLFVFLVLSGLVAETAKGSPRTTKAKETTENEASQRTAKKPASCPSPKNTKAFLECVLKSHPDLQVLYAERRREAARKDKAAQIPNLEFDARLLGGKDSYSAELNLQHTFELGGKRGARIRRAKSQLSVFERKLLLKKQEVVIQTMLALHRLRQLRHEIALIEESSRTYESVRRRFRRLPLLNPDQEMSANIYLFAINENRQHLRMLKNEVISIEDRLRLFSGNGNLNLAGLLPKSYKRWPRLKDRLVKRSPFLDHARSRIALSQSELDYQDSLAWPNFSIGPSLDYQREKSDLPAYLGGGGSRSSTEVGASFAFTIPLYHQNQGGKKVARREKEARRLEARVLEKKLNIWRSSFLKIYNKSVASLNVRGLSRLLAAKHRRLHQLLRRGIVHSSLVIELHRQEYEYVRSSHENELEALRALWQIRAIDGSIFREADERTDGDADTPPEKENENNSENEQEAKQEKTESRKGGLEDISKTKKKSPRPFANAEQIGSGDEK